MSIWVLRLFTVVKGASLRSPLPVLCQIFDEQGLCVRVNRDAQDLFFMEQKSQSDLRTFALRNCEIE